MRIVVCLAVMLVLAGCAELSTEKPDEAPQPVEANPPAPEPVPAAKPVQPTHFLKREAPLVDRKKAMAENPNLVEIERNRITASDYLSAVAQGYFAAASRIEVLNLQNAVNQLHALNDRYPTFEEFQDLLKQTGVRLGHLYEYQMYAYDDETGDICILEDRERKKQIYEAAGREYTDGQ